MNREPKYFGNDFLGTPSSTISEVWHVPGHASRAAILDTPLYARTIPATRRRAGGGLAGGNVEQSIYFHWNV